MTRTDLVESGAGWYVLVWSGEAGLDAWLESNADRVGAFADGCYGEIEWLSEEESASVPGVTCDVESTRGHGSAAFGSDLGAARR